MTDPHALATTIAAETTALGAIASRALQGDEAALAIIEEYAGELEADGGGHITDV